ncbi:MAG: hypothetical protein JW990_18365 [Thermoleophilia bacterium]|nr:hypothetical protein [Thermoleophilia bacterium]
MARGGQFSFEGRSDAAEWSFDGSYLVLTPEGGAPLSFPVAELAGIAGDGYTLVLTVTGAAVSGTGTLGAAGTRAVPARRAELIMSRLGADGPTLLEELRRTWIGARAEILRLGGSGKGKPFSGRVTGLDAGAVVPSSLPEPFQALLFEDVLVIAREARDLDPMFLALFGAVEHDEAAYAVRVRQWPGQEVLISKLGGQTEEFLKRLRANRAQLAEEAAAILAAAVPALPSGPRGMLAGMWLPGRLMEIEAMEAVCPGFTEALRGTWLAALPRREEGEHLLEWAAGGSAWLGCTRGLGGDGSPAGGGEAAPGAGADNPLWLLCGKHGVWFLEALSIEDRATYCFVGGEEVPALVSRLLCAPQFSREALYSPLSELTGERAGLAVPAQYLGFLVELRNRLKDRVIHQTTQGWKKDIAELGKSVAR